jgi:NTP pyrophosphatase (non-canonical NTP hydrolase)
MVDYYSSIPEWMKDSVAVAESKGFSATDNVHRSLLLIVGEVAEAQNELRTGHEPTDIYYDGDKPEGFPIELADVVLRVFNLAASLKIDLTKAMFIKHEYNQTRPMQHGGKLF